MIRQVLPEIVTTSEFKERVEHTCKTLQVQYAAVVTHLLEEWINGTIALEIEPDPEFAASAREAFRSEDVKQTLKQLEMQYDPTRTYPHSVCCV